MDEDKPTAAIYCKGNDENEHIPVSIGYIEEQIDNLLIPLSIALDEVLKAEADMSNALSGFTTSYNQQNHREGRRAFSQCNVNNNGWNYKRR